MNQITDIKSGLNPDCTETTDTPAHYKAEISQISFGDKAVVDAAFRAKKIRNRRP